MSDDAARTRVAGLGRLAQRRKAVGLTQEQLARQLDVERTTVLRWERGQTQPQPWLRPKLAKALAIPVDRIEELLAASTTPAEPDRRGAAVPLVPRQVPLAVADFTGRAVELAALTGILDQAGAGSPGTMVISAISGTAGVGKTALAVHWAHQAAARFGDGQLYANLRGYGPVGTPAAPEAVIRGFLEALGVQPERIPPRLDAQAGLYHSLLADRNMLIVLDNARDEQQVRPLLPASVGSLVLVTSRNQLSGLAADGARLLSLDTLTEGEAVQLLTARLGHARAAAEPGVLAEIAKLCACLPLALVVAAARAAARPSFPLTALACELRDSAGRLDALDAGEPTVSVQAVFSWSYRQLNPEAARMFRLLGLHPGPDVSVPAAASLAGVAAPEARLVLGELIRVHLIAEHVPGRYAFHDLLRVYAAGQACASDSEPGRATATSRVLGHYLHTARTADLLLQPSHEPINLAPAPGGVTPERLTSWEEAAAWFKNEHHVLIAAATLAADTGFDVHAWQIPWTMWTFLDRRGRWSELAALLRSAAAAAVRLGDTAGQATSRRLLACACIMLTEYDEAHAHLAASVALWQQLGDRAGEARARMTVGWLADRQGRYADALGHVEQALRLFQAIGHRTGQVDALNAIGWCHAHLGHYEQARTFCRRALALYRQAGDRAGEAATWDNLGYAEHHLGHLDRAVGYYSRALSLYRDLGDRGGEASILRHLGDTRQAAGELAQARDAWQDALAILDDTQHPDADQVRAKLDGRTRQPG